VVPPGLHRGLIEGLSRFESPGCDDARASGVGRPASQTFCADNDGALRLVVEHLAKLGHERIGFVIDPVNEHTAEGRARAWAFTRAISEAHLHGDVLVWDYDGSLSRGIAKAAAALALVVFSDTPGRPAPRRMPALWIDVPGDLSIVGFDSSSFCETTKPRLTSVNHPLNGLLAKQRPICLL